MTRISARCRSSPLEMIVSIFGQCRGCECASCGEGSRRQVMPESFQSVHYQSPDAPAAVESSASTGKSATGKTSRPEIVVIPEAVVHSSSKNDTRGSPVAVFSQTSRRA